MSLKEQTFPFTGGIDRSVIPLRSDPSTFWNLLNFRHDMDIRGKLEQTPFFRLYNDAALAQGTYYNAGSLTEPTGSKVQLISAGLVITDYIFRYGPGAQLQTFYQTTVPTAENVNTGCRLDIEDVTSLGITLGSSLDVEIHTDATHFRWRKNAGAWSADLVVSTAGVSIDGGNAIVYFLANSGFTVTDTWSWTRLDRSSFVDPATVSVTTPMEITYYKNEAYFTSTDYRIMLCRLGATAGRYIISLGYRPVYGGFVRIFDDHLVIGKFAKTNTAITGITRSRTIGWSDKTDLHNFIPTDVNEADSVVLSFNLQDDSIATTSGYLILGLAVLNQQLHVLTTLGRHTTSALGLPLVFSYYFNEAPRLLNTTANYSTILADRGVYLVSAKQVFYFTGSDMTEISAPVSSMVTSFANFGYYNSVRRELVLFNSATGLIFTYVERTGTWYTRSASFADTVGCVYCGADGKVYLGQANRRILAEDTAWTAQPVADLTSGAAYCTPKITTQLIGRDLSNVKEASTTYIGPSVTNVSATFYSTNADAQVRLFWELSTNGLLTGTTVTNTDAVWVNTASDGTISAPHLSFRGVAYEIQLNGLVSNKPPGQVTITAIEPVIRWPDSMVTK